MDITIYLLKNISYQHMKTEYANIKQGVSRPRFTELSKEMIVVSTPITRVRMIKNMPKSQPA